MPMYRRVLYYINIYIYIYSLSVGRGSFILGVSAGCQPPLLQGVAVMRLSMVDLAGTVSPVGELLKASIQNQDMLIPTSIDL